MSQHSQSNARSEEHMRAGDQDDFVGSLMKTPTMYQSLTPSRSLKPSVVNKEELQDVTKVLDLEFGGEQCAINTADTAGLDHFMNEQKDPGLICSSLIFSCCVCSSSLVGGEAVEGELILSSCGHVAHRQCGLSSTQCSDKVRMQANENTCKKISSLGEDVSWFDYVVSCATCGNHLAMNQYNLPFHSNQFTRLLEQDENVFLRELIEKSTKQTEHTDSIKSAEDNQLPGNLQHVEQKDGSFSTYFSMDVDLNDQAFKTSTTYDLNDQMKVPEGTFVRVKSHMPFTVVAQSPLHNLLTTLIFHERASSRRAVMIEKQCNAQSTEASINASRALLQSLYKDYLILGRKEAEQKSLKRVLEQSNQTQDVQCRREQSGIPLSKFPEISQVYGALLTGRNAILHDKSTAMKRMVAEDAGIVVKENDDTLAQQYLVGLSNEQKDSVGPQQREQVKKQSNPFLIKNVKMYTSSNSGTSTTSSSSSSSKYIAPPAPVVDTSSNAWLQQLHSICAPELSRVHNQLVIDQKTKELKLEQGKRTHPILLSTSTYAVPQVSTSINKVVSVNEYLNLLKGKLCTDSTEQISPKKTGNIYTQSPYDQYDELDKVSVDKIIAQVRFEEAEFIKQLPTYHACLDDSKRQYGMHSQEVQQQQQQQDTKEARQRDQQQDEELRMLKKRKMALLREKKVHIDQRDTYQTQICDEIVQACPDHTHDIVRQSMHTLTSPVKPSLLRGISMLPKMVSMKPTSMLGNTTTNSSLSKIASKVVQKKLHR